MGNRRFDSDDEIDADETRPQGSCCCCPLSFGMTVSGAIIAAMTIANILFLVYTSISGSPILNVVSALMRNSSSIILWIIGGWAAVICAVTPIVRHPVGLLQMAYLNLFVCVAFALIVIRYGYTATNDAYIMEEKGKVIEFATGKLAKVFPKKTEFLGKTMAHFSMIATLMLVVVSR